MEKEIIVKVRVNSDEHAETIMNEIADIVKLRTVIYFVGEPKEIHDGRFIADEIQERSRIG